MASKSAHLTTHMARAMTARRRTTQAPPNTPARMKIWTREQFQRKVRLAPIFLGFCNCLEKRAIKSRIWLGSPGSDNLSLALLLFPVQAHRGQDWQEEQIRFWRNWDSRLELSLRPSQLLEYGQGVFKLPLQLIRGHFAPCRHYLPRAITWSKANLN